MDEDKGFRGEVWMVRGSYGEGFRGVVQMRVKVFYRECLLAGG
jgi:hypothetical protein